MYLYKHIFPPAIYFSYTSNLSKNFSHSTATKVKLYNILHNIKNEEDSGCLKKYESIILHICRKIWFCK